MSAGLEFVQEEGRFAIETNGFCVAFHRRGERWEHVLTLGARSEVVASSVESDPGGDATRVVSPAYQDVQKHSSEENAIVLLLTGQSGPHHYSAVVSARNDGARLLVDVDVADRCRAPVDVLAATYLIRLGSSALVDAGTDQIVWGGSELGDGRLEFAAVGSDSVALAEAGRSATRVQALARIIPSTHTQRLHYRWRWSPAIARS